MRQQELALYREYPILPPTVTKSGSTELHPAKQKGFQEYLGLFQIGVRLMPQLQEALSR